MNIDDYVVPVQLSLYRLINRLISFSFSQLSLLYQPLKICYQSTSNFWSFTEKHASLQHSPKQLDTTEISDYLESTVLYFARNDRVGPCHFLLIINTGICDEHCNIYIFLCQTSLIVCSQTRFIVLMLHVSVCLWGVCVVSFPHQSTWWTSVARQSGVTAWSSTHTRNPKSTTLWLWRLIVTSPCRPAPPKTRCSSTSASSWSTVCYEWPLWAPPLSSQSRLGALLLSTLDWSPPLVRARGTRVMLAHTFSSMMDGTGVRLPLGLLFVGRVCRGQCCPQETTWPWGWWHGGLSPGSTLWGTSPPSDWVRKKATSTHSTDACCLTGKHTYLDEWQ